MRIFVFSTAYYPFVGGAEVAIKEITDRLPEHEWHLFTARMRRNLPQVEKIGNVTVHRVGFGWGAFDKWMLMKWGGWRAYIQHRKTKADIAWSMMANWGGLAAWLFSVLNSKTPLVVTLQEGDEISKRKLGLVALGWRLILSRAKLVTVISNYLGAEARKYWYKGEIVLVPNGVDIKKFKNKSSTLKNENDVTLITTSRLVEKNGVGDIIEALKLLPSNVKLLIAGIGPLENKLKLQVKNANLEGRVTFLGFIDNEKLPEYLRQADIFVRPSLSEGMGISFLEAMAAGIPVIGTMVGGIPDFLKDGETGFVCEPQNPESIAKAVERILSNKDEVSKVTTNAKKMIEEKYDWDKIAVQMNEALNEASGK